MADGPAGVAGYGRQPPQRRDDDDWLQQPLPVLHKDFYLSHPDPLLQCEEFCWGNLEAAHPVLGARSNEEVTEYRRQHGIQVQAVRGRAPPKPFQSFAETSFPGFVEELAYELFTTDATPFPVQAQAWPCALSGADLVVVAPTGSGKTLAFLLPALVHIMAQPPLVRGDGPIALLLEPTRELAEQTLKVAERFCERTTGEDMLRAGAVFGGVDPRLQLPSDGVPDCGRWPELLVATPGRLLDLLGRRRVLDTRRVSYVVLDEADQLLSPGEWLPQVRAVLAFLRPDRQLLMLSATWPAEAEAAAAELSGDELMQIRVHPSVPQIPQVVRLFPGTEGDTSVIERKAALARWLQTDLQPEEAVLILCVGRHTARDLANSRELVAALPASGGRADHSSIALMDDSSVEQERHGAYWRFIHGEVRALVATFALGSRGLDYADTVSSDAKAAAPLSLVVLLFDFPQTINDYAHCIGRTSRPSQRAGRVVAFLPEMRFWIARELCMMLEHCGQPVPQELLDLVDEDRRFLMECRQAMLWLREGGAPRGGGPGCGGDFDASCGVWKLPPSLPSYRRKLLHWLADEMGLPHVSAGESRSGRRLHVARDRESLPDKFFIEGEEVLVEPARGRGFKPVRGIVTDPRIHRRFRTVRVRFPCGAEEDVPADAARPCDGGA